MLNFIIDIPIVLQFRFNYATPMLIQDLRRMPFDYRFVVVLINKSRNQPKIASTFGLSQWRYRGNTFHLLCLPGAIYNPRFRVCQWGWYR